MTCPCVFITNEAYAPYLGVVIQSVIDNASAGNTYIFYVLYRDLRAETMERFNNHVTRFPNCSIKFVDVSSYVEGIKLYAGNWVPEVYFKLLAPYVLTGHDKLLFLDSDVVVNIDAAQLFEMDLGGYVLAAGRALCVIGLFEAAVKKHGGRLPEKVRRQVGLLADLKNPYDYINSGVLLFNAPAFRGEINFDALMNAAGSREWPAVDQDVFNVFCEGKILFLPMKYHFQVIFWPGTTHVPERFRAEYDEAKENPAVLHFILKPWNFAYHTWFFPYFWAAAARSPYFNEIQRRMRENGCLCDFSEDSIGEYIKRLIKEGKKGRRLAFKTVLKYSLNIIHKIFLG